MKTQYFLLLLFLSIGSSVFGQKPSPTGPISHPCSVSEYNSFNANFIRESIPNGIRFRYASNNYPLGTTFKWTVYYRGHDCNYYNYALGGGSGSVFNWNFGNDNRRKRFTIFLEVSYSGCVKESCGSYYFANTGLDGLSINDNDNSINGIIVYPNPVVSNLNIDFLLEKETITNISILDTTGKQVHQEQHNGIQGQNNVQLNLSSLPNGIYYVKMNNDSFHKTERIIIQK